MSRIKHVWVWWRTTAAIMLGVFVLWERDTRCPSLYFRWLKDDSLLLNVICVFGFQNTSDCQVLSRPSTPSLSVISLSVSHTHLCCNLSSAGKRLSTFVELSKYQHSSVQLFYFLFLSPLCFSLILFFCF